MPVNSKDNFSLALGLFDYINPIFYCITSITLINNFYSLMSKPLFVVMVIGQIISMIFGLSIPTVKCMVGLGKMKFKMPVNLVCYVNIGIFISGLCIFTYVFNINYLVTLVIALVSLLILFLIYRKVKKFNTIAVLVGMIGYILIYSALIFIAINNNFVISIVLYAIAIVLFLSLVIIGCTANLKDARIHWVIETSNVLCQGLVAISTILLFK